jgi:hypothetical protein
MRQNFEFNILDTCCANVRKCVALQGRKGINHMKRIQLVIYIIVIFSLSAFSIHAAEASGYGGRKTIRLAADPVIVSVEETVSLIGMLSNCANGVAVTLRGDEGSGLQETTVTTSYGGSFFLDVNPTAPGIHTYSATANGYVMATVQIVAAAQNPDYAFFPSSIKTGYKWQNNAVVPKSIKRTAIFICPANEVNEISVERDPNTQDRIDTDANGKLEVVGRVAWPPLAPPEAQISIIIFNVYGKSETPPAQPLGDTTIIAKKGAVVIQNAQAQAIVVVPKTNTHVAGQSVLQNYTIPFGGLVMPKTKASSIITITIKDQFGQILDDVYNGSNVVIEKFTNLQGDNVFPPVNVEHIIAFPDRQLLNGVKFDEQWIDLAAGTPIGVLQAPQWIAGNLLLNGANNALKASLPRNLQGTATQEIRVHGHHVTPDFNRTVTINKANHPPIPFNVVDAPP